MKKDRLPEFVVAGSAVLVAIALYSLMFFLEFKTVSETNIQTIVIALVGVIGFGGVIHQIKKADDRSKSERLQINKEKMAVLRETLREKTARASSILKAIDRSEDTAQKKLIKTKALYIRNEVGYLYWSRQPELLIGIPRNFISSLTYIVVIANSIEDELMEIEFGNGVIADIHAKQRLDHVQQLLHKFIKYTDIPNNTGILE